LGLILLTLARLITNLRQRVDPFSPASIMLVKYRHMFFYCWNTVVLLNVVPFWTKKEYDLQLNQRVYRSSIGKLFHRRNDFEFTVKVRHL